MLARCLSGPFQSLRQPILWGVNKRDEACIDDAWGVATDLVMRTLTTLQGQRLDVGSP